MQLTLLSGYPDFIGRRQAFCGYGKGPERYSRDERDPLLVPPFSFFIDAVFPAITVSGDYIVYGVPSGVGARQTWTLKWIELESGEECEDDAELQDEEVQLAGFGGSF